MTMRHRAWLVTLALLVLMPLAAGAAHLEGQAKKPKVVYHLTEPGVDKAQFVPGNVQNHIEGVGRQGVTLGTCGNTMKNFTLTLEQLPQGTLYLPRGGVVRILELVEQGDYIDIRP